MSALLRIEMLIMALCFFFIVFRTINRRKMQIQYSLLWLLIAFCMVIVAAFPQLLMGLSSLVGIKVPANLLYFLGILALLMLCFSLSSIVSKQSEQIKRLAQIAAIHAYVDKHGQPCAAAEAEKSTLDEEKGS